MNFILKFSCIERVKLKICVIIKFCIYTKIIKIKKVYISNLEVHMQVIPLCEKTDFNYEESVQKRKNIKINWMHLFLNEKDLIIHEFCKKVLNEVLVEVEKVASNPIYLNFNCNSPFVARYQLDAKNSISKTFVESVKKETLVDYWINAKYLEEQKTSSLDFSLINSYLAEIGFEAKNFIEGKLNDLKTVEGNQKLQFTVKWKTHKGIPNNRVSCISNTMGKFPQSNFLKIKVWFD